MKRTRKQADEQDGIKLNPSDVYEIEFLKDCGNGSIHKGDKRVASLPVAVKLHKQGKIKLSAGVLEQAEELGLLDAIKVVSSATKEPKEAK